MKSLIKQLLRENLINEKMVLKDYSTYIELVADDNEQYFKRGLGKIVIMR